MPNFALQGLGSAITDVFAFLGPADQHRLRRTSSGMCEWFDSAAENGSLAFFVTFAPLSSSGPLRWKHATGDPRGDGPKHMRSETDSCPTPPPATVTVHARNYYLSTFNEQPRGETDDAIIDNATIRLVADFPFEHKLVVTGLFGIRSIGDGFCRGVKAVEVEFRGEGSQLRSVGKGWMSTCLKLKSVIFAGFTALEEVGDNWMHYCSSLESIIFIDDMPKLKKVGSFWMSCTDLKHVNLTGFPMLERAGSFWLSHSSSLESVKFVRFGVLKFIDNGWMSSCPKLKYVNLTEFVALEAVGRYWMSDCLNLESITFPSDMPSFKKVGDSWMSNCPKLKHVDFTGFNALEAVGDSWLHYCSNLEGVTFAGEMPNLKKVGDNWMRSCPKLKQVDLTCFTSLEEVGEHWMYNCSSLESVTISGAAKSEKCWLLLDD